MACAGGSSIKAIVPLCMPCLSKKSSSVRAMTSTIALPIPRTSKRVDGMAELSGKLLKGTLVTGTLVTETLGGEAHYNRRLLQGKARTCHGDAASGVMALGRRKRR